MLENEVVDEKRIFVDGFVPDRTEALRETLAQEFFLRDERGRVGLEDLLKFEEPLGMRKMRTCPRSDHSLSCSYILR